MRTSAIVTAAAICGTALTSSISVAAHADPPSQSETTNTVVIPTWADCSTYAGANDGTISAVATVTRRTTLRTLADGTVRETRHVHYTGVLTGPSGTGTYEGSFRLVLEGPTVTRTGLAGRIYLPDRVAPLIAAGHDEVTEGVATGTPHSLSPSTYSAVCQAIG